MSKNAKFSIGPMQLVLGFFVISAVVRVGSQSIAIAEASVALPTEIVSEAESCQPEESVSDLLQAIRDRQKQISQRESEIAERQQVLNAAEKQISQQLVILREAEARLAETLAIADGAAENDLARLTEVYEKMKPKNAAKVFETMDMTFAAGFLSRMRPEAAAGILSEMPAETAYSISVVMAGRNAQAPTE